ncbi:hypothetical protein GIB67_013633, partial [Kingdonia uniflora]
GNNCYSFLTILIILYNALLLRWYWFNHSNFCFWNVFTPHNSRGGLIVILFICWFFEMLSKLIESETIHVMIMIVTHQIPRNQIINSLKLGVE